MKLKDLIFGRKPIQPDSGAKPADSTHSLVPVADIRNGVIITCDGRFVKILEVIPVNFHLKSAREQAIIIAAFAAYLKVAPADLQIRSLVTKANIEGYIRRMEAFYKSEGNGDCRNMIADNIALIEHLASNAAYSRRFFLIFQYEGGMRGDGLSVEAVAHRLSEQAETARRYLDLCDLECVVPRYSDNAQLEILYDCIQKRTSGRHHLPEMVFDQVGKVFGQPDDDFERS